MVRWGRGVLERRSVVAFLVELPGVDTVAGRFGSGSDSACRERGGSDRIPAPVRDRRKHTWRVVLLAHRMVDPAQISRCATPWPARESCPRNNGTVGRHRPVDGMVAHCRRHAVSRSRLASDQHRSGNFLHCGWKGGALCGLADRAARVPVMRESPRVGLASRRMGHGLPNDFVPLGASKARPVTYPGVVRVPIPAPTNCRRGNIDVHTTATERPAPIAA